MAHSRAHHVLWFFRFRKGLSIRRKILLHSHCTKRAPNSFDDQGPLRTADSFPAFEATPQTVWLLHFVSPPCWQKCMPVYDLWLSTARHPDHQPF